MNYIDLNIVLTYFNTENFTFILRRLSSASVHKLLCYALKYNNKEALLLIKNRIKTSILLFITEPNIDIMVLEWLYSVDLINKTNLTYYIGMLFSYDFNTLNWLVNKKLELKLDDKVKPCLKYDIIESGHEQIKRMLQYLNLLYDNNLLQYCNNFFKQIIHNKTIATWYYNKFRYSISYTLNTTNDPTFVKDLNTLLAVNDCYCPFCLLHLCHYKFKEIVHSL